MLAHLRQEFSFHGCSCPVDVNPKRWKCTSSEIGENSTDLKDRGSLPVKKHGSRKTNIQLRVKLGNSESLGKAADCRSYRGDHPKRSGSSKYMGRKRHKRKGKGPKEVLQRQVEEKGMVGTEVGMEGIKAGAGKLGYCKEG